MTSRLIKAVRKVFRIKPRPPRMAADCTSDGQYFRLTHEFYGPLQLFAADQCISWCVVNGRSLWEPGIVDVFRREIRDGRNVLDVGANLGLHSIVLAKHLLQLGRGGTVTALEPHPEIFPLARFNGSNCSNLKLINKAASDSARSFSMPSIVGSLNAGGVGIVDGEHAGQLAVESVTIDSLGLENVGFMKIDVEGHEIACLRGAEQTIRRDKPTLVVEIMGGCCVRKADAATQAEFRSRLAFVCDFGYTAERITDNDYLFRPR